jgi:hypothetical protein
MIAIMHEIIRIDGSHDQGIMLIGVVFKSTQPDETEEERRELERLVAEAAKPKKKARKEKGPAHTPPQNLAPSGELPPSTAKQ